MLVVETVVEVKMVEVLVVQKEVKLGVAMEVEVKV